MTARLAAAAMAMLLTATAAFGAQPAPRWWCPLVKPPARANDPLLREALARRDAEPQPMAHLQTHALLPHQGIRDASERAERDWPIVLRAAIAWRMSADPALLRQVDRYLGAWSQVYVPNFNPIDETNLDQLFQAYQLSRDALSARTRKATALLIRRMADGYLARLRARAGSNYINDLNNWQSHRIKLLATAAAALDDGELIAAARHALAVQVAANIQPDGQTVDFVQRDALHYVSYDLQPLVQAALALSPYGDIDLLQAPSATGSSIAGALDWLLPYAEGRRSHREFVHTHEPFDIARRKAGLKGYDGPWDPHTSAALYAYAAVLMPRYRPIARTLDARPLALQACATATRADTTHRP